MTGVTEALSFYIFQNLNLNVNSGVWRVANILDKAILD